MKTTQILLTAFVALLATASLPSAIGQGADSQSYTLQIWPGSNLIANQLRANPDNTLSTLLNIVPDGSQLLKWDETTGTFHADLFDSSAGGWVDENGGPSTTTLVPGEAAFLINPLPSSYELTFSGEPNSAPETFPAMQPNVYYFRSRQTNGPGTWETITGRPAEDGAVLIRWDADGQSYQTNQFAEGRWNPSEPVVEVGEGAAVALAKVLCICFPPTPAFFPAPSYSICSAGTTNFIYAIPGLFPNGCTNPPQTTVFCSPPPGAPFPVGTTTVTCTATMACFNTTNACQFTVTVTGNEPGPPPVMQCPPKIRMYACHAPANVLYQPTATGNVGPVVCVPSSGTAFPFGTHTVTCYATNACGLISSCSFPLVVLPVPKWVAVECPPGGVFMNANGVLQQPIGDAGLSREPVFELPGLGPVGPGPVTRLLAAADGKSAGVQYLVGLASAFRFTTVLDMEAPDGATVEVFDPDADAGERPALTLTLNRSTSSWELKQGIGGIDVRRTIRSSAVNPRGELLGSFLQSLPEDATNTTLALFPEPGLVKFPITLVLERSSGALQVSFPGEIVSAAERGTRSTGWDGLIKGRPAAARVPWDGAINGRAPDASRVSFMPTPPCPATSSVVRIIATGLADLPILAEGISAWGRSVQATPDADVASVHRGTPEGDGLAFRADDDASGPSLDLGYSASISVGFDIVDASALQEGQGIGFQLSGIGSPAASELKTLLKCNLAGSSTGIAVTADFHPLNAVSVIVELYDHGKQVATEQFAGAAIDETNPLRLDRWPETFAVLNTNGVLRLGSASLLKFGCCTGDELRIIPVLPPEAALPAAFGRLTVNLSEGVEAVLRGLARTSAVPPPLLQSKRSSAGIGIEWPGAGYRLLSAETLSGPWIDLGLLGGTALQPVGDARYFQLISE